LRGWATLLWGLSWIGERRFNISTACIRPHIDPSYSAFIIIILFSRAFLSYYRSIEESPQSHGDLEDRSAKGYFPLLENLGRSVGYLLGRRERAFSTLHGVFLPSFLPHFLFYKKIFIFIFIFYFSRTRCCSFIHNIT